MFIVGCSSTKQIAEEKNYVVREGTLIIVEPIFMENFELTYRWIIRGEDGRIITTYSFTEQHFRPGSTVPYFEYK